jgi:hypothetical protein
MTYRIDFSSIAKAEADAAFLSFSQFTTDERAQLWYQGLIKAIVSGARNASALSNRSRGCLL